MPQPSLKVHLDKLNSHRVLEPTVHTDPVFSQASLYLGWFFEAMHQPLSNALWRSTNPNAHVYSGQPVLTRCWLQHVVQASNFVNRREGAEQRCAGLVL